VFTRVQPHADARANPNATAAISAAFNDLRSDMSMLHELHNHLHTVHFSVQELRVKYAELAGTSPFEVIILHKRAHVHICHAAVAKPDGSVRGG
jgi:hypothetical protein